MNGFFPMSLICSVPDGGSHRQAKIGQFRAIRCLFQPKGVNSAILLAGGKVVGGVFQQKNT
jgi:hypothetical protein